MFIDICPQGESFRLTFHMTLADILVALDLPKMRAADILRTLDDLGFAWERDKPRPQRLRRLRTQLKYQHLTTSA